MSTEHPWTDSAASYALGTLDEAERTAFESHLAECPACRAEVQSYQEVVGQLGYHAPPKVAPPHLKARVLAEARQVRPIGAAKKAPTRASSPRLPWLAAAAMLLVAAGISVFYNAERKGRATAVAEADSVRAQLASANNQIARSDSLIALLLAPDVQTTALAAQGRPPSARLYLNRQRGTIVLAAFDLQPARAGRTYQLWGIANGKAPVSLGTFNTEANGRGVVALTTQPGAQFNLTAITEEPAGGSPQPTMQPFLLGTLSQ